MTVVAGKTVSSNCFKICIADLNKKCIIQTRKVSAPNFGETKATETFATLFTGYFKIQTLRGTRRFSGVNIDKRATHIFITRWKASLSEIDAAGEHFINRSDKRFRVIEITDINEHGRYLLFQCTERGLDDNEETDA